MTKRSGPLRVLYVDDDEMALTLTQLQLLNAGMVTEATSDTLEAVGMLATEELDLILLDSVMPTIDGVEFLQLMRSSSIRVPRCVLDWIWVSRNSGRLFGSLGCSGFWTSKKTAWSCLSGSKSFIPNSKAGRLSVLLGALDGPRAAS